MWLGVSTSTADKLKLAAIASIAVAALVLGLKYLAYWVTGSVALYSDALESIVNLITALVALYAIHVSAQPADRRHQFGHHKAEYFSAVIEGVLIVVAAFQLLHAGAGAVGYMTAAIGVGGLLGALGAMTLSGGRLAGSFALSLVFWGVPIALIAPRPYLAVALFMLAVVGAANSVEDVAGFTLLQRTVSDDALTSVLGLFWGLAMGAVALGSLAAPVLVAAIDPRPAFLVVGAILPLVTLAAYRRLNGLGRINAQDSDLDVIGGVPMFAPLSIAAKERLAGKLIPVSVAAGEQVVRAGDTGDRFYIVGDGELDVEIGNDHKTARGTDYFGEIALLRDVPRTATVTATVDSRLYALQRADFLAAVTGHSAAHLAGKAVVDARLGERRTMPS